MLIKIKATLKNFQKENVELLSSRTLNFQKDDILESNWLIDIQKAISLRTQVSITNNSLYKDEQTKRNIEPQAVYFTNNVWIVVAFCHLRNEMREFRLDRISHQETTSLPFETPTDFSLQKYFENSISS